MIRRILSILLLGASLNTYSQGQLKYEYWFDEAYSQRSVASVIGSNLNLDVDVSHLTTGIHLFVLRVMDSQSRWSAPTTTCFLKVPEPRENLIQKYEYWFDDNYGARKASSATSGVFNLDVDVSLLADGIHMLIFRAQSSNGEWSAPSSTMFLKMNMLQTASVTKYEYWIDGDLSAKQIGENTSGLINLDIDVSRVEPGLHCLYFRMQDNKGQWCAPLGHCFVKSSYLTDNRIKAYRYWFNGAHEDVYNVNLENPISPLELVVDIPVNNILHHASSGDTITVTAENGEQEKAVRNMLYMQFQDNYYQWSSIQVDTFVTLVSNNVIVSKDLAILAELYQMTGGDSHWYVKWPTLNQTVQSNELSGVSTYKGHVTTINLKGNNLRGSFPHVVFELDSLRVLNLEDNQINGTLDGSAIPSTLSELKVSGNKLSMLTGQIPSTVGTLSLNRQCMDVLLPFDLSEQRMQIVFSQIPNICLYDQKLHTFTRIPRLSITTDSGGEKILGYLYQNQGKPLFEQNKNERFVYNKPMGDTLYCYDDLGNRFMLKFIFNEGDANFDGQVDVRDLSSIVLFCLQAYESVFNFGAADLWKDSVMNVQDAVCLVNVLLESMPPVQNSPKTPGRRGGLLDEDTPEAMLSCSDGLLQLITPVPVSAFDIVIDDMKSTDVISQLESQGFVVCKRQQGEATHLIGYSPIGNLIPAGQTIIAKLKKETATISAALLADDRANAVYVVSSNTTGLDKVNIDIMADVANGYIRIATSEVLDNVSWKLLSVGGIMLDGGTIDKLPSGISNIPYKAQTDGVVLLLLKAEGCLPIVRKVYIR